MKKAFLFIIALIFVLNNSDAQENFKWEKTDSLNKTKEQIYSDSKLFIAKTWNSANDVIQNDDKEAGIILLKGASIRKVNFMSGEYVYIYKYTMTIKMKNGKYKIELNDVYCDKAYMTGSSSNIVKIEPFEGDNCPPTGTMRAMGLPKKQAIIMMADFKKSLQDIVDSYEKAIKKTDKDEW